MIKFISKFLAKRYVEKHKSDNIILNTANLVFNKVEFYSDLTMYIILYSLVTVLFIIGIPLGIFILTQSIGYTILSFLISFIIGIGHSLMLARNIFISVRRDIYTILKNRNDKWNDTRWWENKK